MPSNNGKHNGLANARVRRVVDFNEFRREYRAKKMPVVIPIDDAEYEFPAEMPASIMLELMEFMSQHEDDDEDPDIPARLVVQMLEDMLGGDQLRVIIRTHQLDQTELFWLFEQIMGIYKGQPVPDNEPEGNAPEPETAEPSTSSKTGRSSKRTSSASTG